MALDLSKSLSTMKMYHPTYFCMRVMGGGGRGSNATSKETVWQSSSTFLSYFHNPEQNFGDSAITAQYQAI